MSTEKIMTLNNIGLKYKKRLSLSRAKAHEYWALKDVSITVYKGESLGIVGGNGAGKSTLLRVMANLIAPDKGKVIRHQKLSTSLLSLNSGFMPELTGYQNAVLKGLYLGMPRSYIDKNIARILEISELNEFIHDPIRGYSTGMKARLGFAVSYVCLPDILLIDETLGVGDKAFKKKSGELIKNLINSDKTVVIVSHDELTMSKLCNRVVQIENGIIQ